MREVFFAGDVAKWLLVLPDFGEIEGPFQISELAYSGEHDGEASFTVTLESAGALSFRRPL